MLFPQHENDIVTLQQEDAVVVIGSYTGNGDYALDKIAADTVLAALFPDRYLEVATVVVSSNTATLVGGAYSSELVPMVYKNGTLLATTEYTEDPTTGRFHTFTTPLGGADAITVTLAKFCPGVNAVEQVVDFPQKVTDVKAFGSNVYVYRTTSSEDDKYTINIKGAFDRKITRRKYGASDLAKALYGSQWSASSGVANQYSRNTNPFFVAVIWWYPSAATGEVKMVKNIFYKCTLQKAMMPKPEGTDKEASFEIDALALYAYQVQTLA